MYKFFFYVQNIYSERKEGAFLCQKKIIKIITAIKKITKIIKTEITTMKTTITTADN